MRHPELHRSERIGWLRAAVLGADDGILSTASLVVGVAAALVIKTAMSFGKGEALLKELPPLP